jgi:integrase/DNA-directed RNA polymerase subunit RPC12/RpoP
VVEEKRLEPHNVMPENQITSLGSGSELPVAQPSSNTTTITCPKCGSQRNWKDGIRYTPYGEIQRYRCRDCAYRFSFSERSEPFEPHQKVHRQILSCGSAIPSNRQVGVSQTKAMINLAEVTRTQEKAAGATEAKPTTLKGKLIEYAWWLQKEGYSQTTIFGRSRLLKILTKRGVNLYDPESVKNVIARQPWSEGRKANAVDAYSSFLKMTGGKWEPPRYQGVRKIPFIPTETEVDQLIAGCSIRMGTFVQLLKETGIRSGEAWRLTWHDLDTMTKTVRVTAEKRSNPRIFHVSQKLAAMFEALPKIYGDGVFSTPQQPLDHHRDHFTQQRKRMAQKLKNPRLLRITFHTLRHFKGTMEYHRTKDILHVMQTLGHKNIKNTLIYVQLAEELFKDQQEYISKVGKTEKDVCALIDAGFEFVCDFNGAKIFRKRKY